MLKCIAVSAAIAAMGCGNSGEPNTFGYLEVEDHTVISTNATPLRVRGPAELTLIGPYNYIKTTDAGVDFKVSLASFVGPGTVVSIPAERLAEPDGSLDYSKLPRASWPTDAFGILASTCMSMTHEQAEQLPESTGVHWVLKAGFQPEGEFAVHSVIRASEDGDDEISIEIITRVNSCEDAAAVGNAIDRIRRSLTIERA